MKKAKDDITDFDRVYKRQLKNFGLNSIEWRFGYPIDSCESGYCYPGTDNKTITICRDGGENISSFEFRLRARHELFHWKYRDRWFNNEIFASIFEYLPLERIVK
ncbi:hypothetical protein HYT26_02250 [Candidatus Pacearchaeota archaeon]|nr:hypothetical protein [Candidatus Pacearchaeota archaeon]